MQTASNPGTLTRLFSLSSDDDKSCSLCKRRMSGHRLRCSFCDARHSLSASVCAHRAAPFLFLIVNIAGRQDKTYLCRCQSSVRVYSTIDPVSAQMNGSRRLSAAARDLKPFQVSEGKTDHSLCHVGIPNPGQLLR